MAFHVVVALASYYSFWLCLKPVLTLANLLQISLLCWYCSCSVQCVAGLKNSFLLFIFLLSSLSSACPHLLVTFSCTAWVTHIFKPISFVLLFHSTPSGSTYKAHAWIPALYFSKYPCLEIVHNRTSLNDTMTTAFILNN